MQCRIRVAQGSSSPAAAMSLSLTKAITGCRAPGNSREGPEAQKDQYGSYVWFSDVAQWMVICESLARTRYIKTKAVWFGSTVLTSTRVVSFSQCARNLNLADFSAADHVVLAVGLPIVGCDSILHSPPEDLFLEVLGARKRIVHLYHLEAGWCLEFGIMVVSGSSGVSLVWGGPGPG